MTSKQWSKPPEMKINPTAKYTATFKTDVGDIVCSLYAAKAPRTVNNFVFLAREGFYDNTIFHRVIANFMAQGGDPTGTGTGGPGYKFNDEFDSSLKHNNPGFFPWRMPVQIPMAASFLSPMCPPPGWITSIPCLVR